MQKYLIGNLKMNILTLAERERYFAALKKEIKEQKIGGTSIILCPPSLHLESFTKNIKNKAISFGAQNMFSEKAGSYTGEISPLMIKALGGEYVIIGHSERRRYFGETNEMANVKIKLAIKSGLKPIYCIGETKEERAENLTKNVITKQITEAIDGITPLSLEKIILAYEPMWSVGTNLIPTANEIMEVKIMIKKTLAQKYNLRIAEKVTVLYGGSVNAKTVRQVCVEPEMSGVLVGRESLNPREFIKIAEIIGN